MKRNTSLKQLRLSSEHAKRFEFDRDQQPEAVSGHEKTQDIALHTMGEEEEEKEENYIKDMINPFDSDSDIELSI